MSRYFLGVDIGGTKSHALIADESGNASGFGIGGSGNYEGVGYEGFSSTMQDILRQALETSDISIDQVAGAGFGVAGYDWPKERPLILKAIADLNLKCPFEAVNDTIVGLLAGSSQGWGVAIVAGTGENCWGWTRERRVGRVTGKGMQMGEYGGASTVMYKAIQEVSKAWSRRGPRTALTDAFIVHVGAKDEADLLEGLVLGAYHLEADDTLLVFDVAERGDSVAIQVLRWAGQELAGMANGVIRQLDLEKESFEVVLVGSMFKGGSLLLDPMYESILAVAPGAQFVHLAAPPVVGGVLLGMESASVAGLKVRENLIASTNEIISRFDESKTEVA